MSEFKHLRKAADTYEYALANGHEPPSWIWAVDFTQVTNGRSCPRGQQDMPIADVDEYGLVTWRAPTPDECSPRALASCDAAARPSLNARINARGFEQAKP